MNNFLIFLIGLKNGNSIFNKGGMNSGRYQVENVLLIIVQIQHNAADFCKRMIIFTVR